MEALYYFAFSSCTGIGPVKFDTLVSVFGSAQEAYHAGPEMLTKYLGPSLTDSFIRFRSVFAPEEAYAAIIRQGIRIIPRCDDVYPSSLRNLTDPPICLYVKGDIAGYDFTAGHFFSIVGTRKPSQYGLDIAAKFSSELAQAGCIIVSGMALGIDSAAHWGALSVKGKTIAVLGCGVNVVYPPSNRNLYDAIISNGGLVLSEFPPDKTVLKGLFVSRNRLIAALSCGTMVVEGLKNSGSLVTARCALDMGKEVFAPPGLITSVQSEAPHLLLKSGAKLVTSIEDILDELGLSMMTVKHKDIRSALSGVPLQMYDVLTKQASSADDIARQLGIPIADILPIVTEMEIKGVIKRTPSGLWHAVW